MLQAVSDSSSVDDWGAVFIFSHLPDDEPLWLSHHDADHHQNRHQQRRVHRYRLVYTPTLTPDGKCHSIYTRGQLFIRHSLIINNFLWNWFDERVWSSFYLEIQLQLRYECFSKFWTIGCIELKYFKIKLNWSTRFLIFHRPSNLSRVITNLLLFNILSRLS